MSIYPFSTTPPSSRRTPEHPGTPARFEEEGIAKVASLSWLTQVQYLSPSASHDALLSLQDLAQNPPANDEQNPELAVVIEMMRRTTLESPKFNPNLSYLAERAIENIASQSSSSVRVFSPGKVTEFNPSPAKREKPPARRDKPPVARRLDFENIQEPAEKPNYDWT